MVHYGAYEARRAGHECDGLVGVATATRTVPRGLGGTGRGRASGSPSLGAVLATCGLLFLGARGGCRLDLFRSLIILGEGRGSD